MPDDATNSSSINELKTPYLQTADTIRSTAKWLVTAFAAVGGALIAGIPLTKVGDIHDRQLHIALACVLVALLAIGAIIFLVARVFTAEYISLPSLVDKVNAAPRNWLSRLLVEREWNTIESSINQNGHELYGTEATSLGELYEKITLATRRLREESTPSAEREAAEKTLPRLNEAAQRVVDYANYVDARRHFLNMYIPSAVLALVVALSVAAFAYEVGAAPNTLHVTSPSRVLVKLTPEGVAKWRNSLGPACDTTKPISAVAISGDFSAPTVVTSGENGCNIARIDMVEKAGTVVPIISAQGPAISKTP